MLYEEARVYLEQVSKYGSVLGLESIRELLSELDDPQEKLKFIHIAGTNGKGSTLSYISNILMEAGYRTGAYISPTVLCYLERFQINGEHMNEEDFAELTSKVKDAVECMEAKGKPSPTAFEIETAISFLYFAKYNCDYVVLETGLGGELDATNVVETKILTVFASISKDHMAVLGDTLEEIATTKAGIMRRGVPVISTVQEEEVTEVLKNEAEENKSIFIQTDISQVKMTESSLKGQMFSYKDLDDIYIRLLGKHQIENAMTAIEAARMLGISDDNIFKGLEKARWTGRFEVLSEEPLIIVDGAHNADAAKRLAENIELYLSGKKITAIMGVFKDKEYQKIVRTMVPHVAKVYTVDLPDKERNLGKENLKSEFEQYNIDTETAESMIEAIRIAKKDATAEDAILVFGSLSHLREAILFITNEGE